MARVKVECAWCGSRLERKQSLVFRSKSGRFFCDTACKGLFHSNLISGENHPNWKGGMVSVKCAWCGKEKLILKCTLKKHKHHFCKETDCLAKWRSQNYSGENHYNYKGGNVKVNCAWCGKEKEVVSANKMKYKNHFCGDKDCYSRWISANKAGKSCPAWRGGGVTSYCAYCKTPFTVTKYRASNYKNNFCHTECHLAWLKKNYNLENNPNWKNGSSFEPYPLEWNTNLKEAIRERDNKTCQICGKNELENGRKLDVHHIDYDKDNLDPENLISLCWSCHVRTNGNRKHWQSFFQKKMGKDKMLCD